MLSPLIGKGTFLLKSSSNCQVKLAFAIKKNLISLGSPSQRRFWCRERLFHTSGRPENLYFFVFVFLSP